MAADGTKRIVTDNVTPPAAAGDGQKELPIPASTTDLEITKLTAKNFTITPGASGKVEITATHKGTNYTANATGVILAPGDKITVTVTLKAGLVLNTGDLTLAPDGNTVEVNTVSGALNGGWAPTTGKLTLKDQTLAADETVTFTITVGATPGAVSVVFTNS